MFTRIRLELTAALALVVALAAFVMAMRGSDEPAAATQDTAQQSEEAARDFVPKGAARVEIVDFVYQPEPVRVRAGDAVAWTNRDGAPHTVTAKDKSWDSGMLRQGEVYSTTFDQPGVYEYFCELHPPRSGLGFRPAEGVPLAGGGGHGMEGKVIVE